MTSKKILDISDLTISFGKKNAAKAVIHGINFLLNENEILGIVGESGSGKSVTSKAIMGLLPKKNTHIDGSIIFEDRAILSLSLIHI